MSIHDLKTALKPRPQTLLFIKQIVFDTPLLYDTFSFQIGFVLYPLSGPEWDLTMHNNIMFVTMCFCWHIAVALLLVACTFAVVLL